MDSISSGVNRNWNNFPFSPKQWPFFYGWVIVITSTMGILASIPGQTIGITVFTEDLMGALGLSRFKLSSAYMFGTIASSFFLPLAGSIMDRIGLRAMLTFSCISLGLSLLVFSQCDLLMNLEYAGSTVPFVCALVCFFLVRFFGQGCLTLSARVGIGKWFHHKRGLATGISTVFISFGFHSAPGILNDLIQVFGWRNVFLYMALFVGVIMSIISWYFHRDNPEECGLEMDGELDEQWHEKIDKKVIHVQHEFTRSEAVHTSGFWIFNLALASQAFIVTAVVFHVASLGAESGLTREESFSVFMPMAFISVVASFVGGWVSDRTHLRWILVPMMFAQAVGILGLSNFGSAFGQWSFVAGFGISGGLFMTLSIVTWPRFFGRKHLGAITGVNMSTLVFASAIGPVVFSAGRQMTGTYNFTILACSVIPMLLLVAGFFVRNPQETWRTEKTKSLPLMGLGGIGGSSVRGTSYR